MNPQYILCACAALALLSVGLAAETKPVSVPQPMPVPVAVAMSMSMVEDATVAPPHAEMAAIDAEMKTSTEKPPVAAAMPAAVDEKTTAAAAPQKDDAQRHTVADFIIHPLIAFKPRSPDDDAAALGKQSNTGSSSTTPSPWQLFGFNAGQGLGSSVSSLAGSVTGWINDRIQLPGLVETPVRDQSTTTSTSTTTTPRPDVVVKVQQKGSTKKPLISISNNRNGPNRVSNNNLDSDEFDDDFDDDDDDFGNINRFDDEEDDDDDDEDEASFEEVDDDEDDDEEEELVQRPKNRRRPVRNQRRGVQNQGNRNNFQQQQKRRFPGTGARRQGVANNNNQNNNNKRRRVQQQQQQQELESEELEDDDAGDEEFYYGEHHPSTKRSQGQQPNFIQRGQQSLINQIRQLTRGQTPGELGNAIRQSGGQKRRQPTTLLINRNGQTYYAAPELLGAGDVQAQYLQPPLSVPLKRKGRPTQYITIPWAQLGISPPDQLISITEGIQSQPLILNIPQNAILSMQEPPRKKKRPILTPDAVPLFTEASLMDVFKPPKIPPSRTSTSGGKPATSGLTGSPVMIATKPKKTTASKNTAGVALPQRIRPATIVEKAPAMDELEESNEAPQSDDSKSDKEFIMIGDDNEPGLTRQVQPVYGDARYVHVADSHPYFEVLNRGRYAYRKNGRALEQAESAGIVNTKAAATTEQQIPVQVVADAGEQSAPEKSVAVGEKAPAKEAIPEKVQAETDAAPPTIVQAAARV